MSLTDQIAEFTAVATDALRRDAIASDIWRAIVDQHNEAVTLESLIQQLGPSLTNKDEMVRSRGTLLLSCVLRDAESALTLNGVQCHFLTAFFCDRMQDQACVSELAIGLQALCVHHVLGDDEDVILVCRSIFAEMYTQAQDQPTRYAIFTVLSHFLSNRIAAVRQMGTDFVFGYIQCIEGERDPRNLLLIWQMTAIICTDVTGWERFDEELFDLTSCYFPIQYTPRADDNVSQHMLNTALRNALSSTSVFATFLYEFMLEKLSSAVVSTKVDALQTIAYCAQHHGPFAVQSWILQVWNAIKEEIYTSPDAEVVQESLQCIRSLARTLSETSDSDEDTSPLQSLLKPMLSSCLRLLSNGDQSKMNLTSGAILQSVCSASTAACDIVLPKALTVLHTCVMSCDSTTSTSTKHIFLSCLCGFLQQTQALLAKGMYARPSMLIPVAQATQLFEAVASHATMLTSSSSPSTSPSSPSSASLTDDDQTHRHPHGVWDTRLLCLCLRCLTCLACMDDHVPTRPDDVTPGNTDDGDVTSQQPLQQQQQQRSPETDDVVVWLGNVYHYNVVRMCCYAMMASPPNVPLQDVNDVAHVAMTCLACLAGGSVQSEQGPSMAVGPPLQPSTTGAHAPLIEAVVAPVLAQTLLQAPHDSPDFERALQAVRVLSSAQPLAVPMATALVHALVQLQSPTSHAPQPQQAHRWASGLTCLTSLLTMSRDTAAHGASCTTVAERITMPIVSTVCPLLVASLTHMDTQGGEGAAGAGAFAALVSPALGSFLLASAQVAHGAAEAGDRLRAQAVLERGVSQHLVGPVVDAGLRPLLGPLADAVAALPVCPRSGDDADAPLAAWLARLPLDRLMLAPHDAHTADAARLAAAVVNKLPRTHATAGAVVGAARTALREQRSASAVVAVAWLVRALSLCGGEAADEGASLLHELVTVMLGRGSTGDACDDGTAVAVADAIPVVLRGPAGRTDTLSRACGARVRFLADQRLFCAVLKALTTAYHAVVDDDGTSSSSGDMTSAKGARTRMLLVRSVCVALQCAPSVSVLLTELRPLLPVVMQALASQDADVLVSALHTLDVLLREAPHELHSRTSTIVGRTLAAMAHPSARVRLSCARCVAGCIVLPYHQVYPLQERILAALGGLLDDGKRAVRRMARVARNEWFVLSSGAE